MKLINFFVYTTLIFYVILNNVSCLRSTQNVLDAKTNISKDNKEKKVESEVAKKPVEKKTEVKVEKPVEKVNEKPVEEVKEKVVEKVNEKVTEKVNNKKTVTKPVENNKIESAAKKPAEVQKRVAVTNADKDGPVKQESETQQPNISYGAIHRKSETPAPKRVVQDKNGPVRQESETQQPSISYGAIHRVNTNTNTNTNTVNKVGTIKEDENGPKKMNEYTAAKIEAPVLKNQTPVIEVYLINNLAKKESF